ncbi:hypothetical protein LCGC14_1546410 [marine sediment metagenome]|uniref:Uncharacterized protein n=1 Tax=marine sediment metagenome TaxID=412755 RepID=A0A0F9LSD3_9ZZZZ
MEGVVAERRRRKWGQVAKLVDARCSGGPVLGLVQLGYKMLVSAKNELKTKAVLSKAAIQVQVLACPPCYTARRELAV